MASSLPPAADFATTQWSIVVRGGQPGTRAGEEALATLCQTYWFPLYSFVRRQVSDLHEAQDLTQSFFARLLEKNTLAAASPERGRFRSFLLTSLKNFLTNEWHKERTQKRGGGLARLALDLEAGESRLHLEPAHELTPEKLYERHWAYILLERVLERLGQEFAASGKARQFALLAEGLTSDRLDYPALSAELKLSPEATRQAVHRLRKRYRELLRDEVAQTVANPADVDEEIGNLIEVLGT